MNTKGVSYQQLRSATGKVIYNGTTFLIDPMLAEKGRYEGFAGTFNAEVRNPTVELPESKEKIMEGVDAVIVTHTHLDHWDDVAQQFIDKKIPFFVQDEADAAAIRKAGFKNVTVLDGSAEFGGVTLTRVEGTHGTQAMYDDAGLAALLGESMGVVFAAPGEKTVYLLGDTVWTPRVSKTFHAVKPDVLIMNTGYAKILGYNESIIMGTADVAKAAAFLPEAEIVAVHMDAINHCTVSRKNVRALTKMLKIEDRVHVPEDGETVAF
ncbi:MBL fold metallo-hydrolase [uncultured Cloacibacillus sp.]|uniref:MBL fold metallo-hydrolase n=1 Tax=uncultured Cloacibacillus sp. TaxID=889794 RepID=UPI003207E8D6